MYIKCNTESLRLAADTIEAVINSGRNIADKLEQVYIAGSWLFICGHYEVDADGAKSWKSDAWAGKAANAFKAMLEKARAGQLQWEKILLFPGFLRDTAQRYDALRKVNS